MRGRGSILGARALPVTRGAPGEYVSRKFVPGDDEVFIIQGYPEPASSESTVSLSDAQRTRDPKLIISNTELRKLNEKLMTPADVISINGLDYEVMNCEPIEHTLPHWEVLAIRIDEP